jgi:ATP-dependent Clp protease ATP-binding subunit ClpX
MIRTHLIYAGNLHNAVVGDHNSFSPLELAISTIKDKDPKNYGKESPFEMNINPRIKYIKEYKLLGATDGRRFNLGVVFRSAPCFLQEDLEGLEERIKKHFERFKEQGWDISVKVNLFSKEEYETELAQLEVLETEARRGRGMGFSDEERELIISALPEVKKDLKKSLDEKRYTLNVSVNTDEKEELQLFKQVSKQVPGILWGTRTVYEKRSTSFRADDHDDILDKIAEYGEIIGAIIEFYHELNGMQDVDDDLFLHVNYDHPLDLKAPFKVYSVGKRSIFIFDAEKKGGGPAYTTMKEYKEKKTGIVLPVNRRPKPIKIKLPKPSEKQEANGHDIPLHKKLNITKTKIKQALDAYVIGQEIAKDVICAAAYKHYARIYQAQDSVQIKKTNVLLYGPTGCGKTHLLESLAKILDVPMAIADASNLTAPGYVGEDASQMIENLVALANNDRERAQMGIVYIDEIDKLASLGEHATVKTTQVQYNLLKLIEGKIVKTKKGAVDTSNILFVCGGAFAGDPSAGISSLEDRVKARLGVDEREKIGFVASSSSKNQDIDYTALMQYVEPEDLHAYGIIPELVGRLQMPAGLNRLSVEELRKIITEPVNSQLKQAVKLFAQEGIALRFEDEAIDHIAVVAYRKNTGARAIQTNMDKIINPLLDCIGTNKKEIVVTKELAGKYI